MLLSPAFAGVEDALVDTQDEVSLDDHFNHVGQDFRSRAYDDNVTYKGFRNSIGVEMFGVGLLGSKIASNRFLNRAAKLEDAVKELSSADKNVAKRLLLKAKLARSASKISKKVGLYFVIDGATGLVISMMGYKPVVAANAPALASYLLRKGKGYADEPTAAVLEELKQFEQGRAITGSQKIN